MRRAGTAGALALAVIAVPSQAPAQTRQLFSNPQAVGAFTDPPLSPTDPVQSPRNKKMTQAVVDTFAAYCTRVPCTGANATAKTNIQATINAKMAQGTFAAAPAHKTWMQIFKNLTAYMPWPLNYAEGSTPSGLGDWDGAGGGGYGGGGAGCSGSNCWGTGTGSVPGNPKAQCSIAGFKLDPEGNLIIPSYSLKTGSNITNNEMYSWLSAGAYLAADGLGNRQGLGHHMESALRWFAHKDDLVNYPDRRKWWGVVGCADIGSGQTKCELASVAYKDNTGAIVGRRTQTQAQSSFNVYKNPAGSPKYKDCPGQGAGGTMHFYGYGHGNAPEAEDCIMYSPTYNLSSSGYAINDESSIPAFRTDAWPNSPTTAWMAPLMTVLKACNISKDMLAKMTKALCQEGGGTCTGLDTQDARPGDTQVNDLGDDPQDDANPPPTTGPQPSPPNPPATPSSGSGGMTDTCDFAATSSGCTDPGVNATDPTDPTNIFDPIFNWLPDIPSITLGTGTTACPTWSLNLTAYGGPSWQFLLDAHCQLMLDSGGGWSALALTLQAIMLALFVFFGAIIILRA